MAAINHFISASFRGLHVHPVPTREASRLLHANQAFERLHRLQQEVDVQLPPLVDHLVVSSVPDATIFVSYEEDTFAGVRVTGPTAQAVESVDVRINRDTGLEIVLTGGNSGRQILVEVLLPSPQSLRLLEARGSGTIVLESVVANDQYTDIYIHQTGACKVLVSSSSPVVANSLTLEPQGGGLIQFVAPEITLLNSFRAKVAALGSVQVFTGKLTAPLIEMEAAGYGAIQIAALALESSSKSRVAAVDQARVMTIGDSFHAAYLSASTSGEGYISVLAFQELELHSLEGSADGESEVHVASHHAHCDVGHLIAEAKGIVDARDLVVRDTNVHSSGMGTIYVRASEAAHVKSIGYATATLVGALPPRVTGRPTTTPALPSLVETLSETRNAPEIAPSRAEAFEQREAAHGSDVHVPSFSDFALELKLLWGGHRDTEEQSTP